MGSGAVLRARPRTAHRLLSRVARERPYDEFPPRPFDGLPIAARDPEVLGTLLGALSDPAVRASLIDDFERQVLFAWSPEDQVFPLANAQRYAGDLHDGRVALIEDAYSFTPEDRPEALAETIARFAAGE